MNFLYVLRESLTYVAQVRNSIKRGDGLNIRGLTEKITFIKRFIAIGCPQDLNKPSSGRIAQ